MTLLAVVPPVIRQFNRQGLAPITKVENDEIRNKIKLQTELYMTQSSVP